jgi:hypothetical protein
MQCNAGEREGEGATQANKRARSKEIKSPLGSSFPADECLEFRISSPEFASARGRDD